MASVGSRPVVALVTNMPTPYRIPVLNRLANWTDFRLVAVFCSGAEPDREWDLPQLVCEHHFLRENFTERPGRFIHNNVDVIPLLMRIRPQAVITTGFSPTFLYAMAFAALFRLPHIGFSDGTIATEKALGLIHRMVRRVVYRRSEAVIGGSRNSETLFRHLGIDRARIFRSCLAIENSKFRFEHGCPKPFDLMICGRLVPGKLPHFAIRVAERVAHRLGRTVSILIVGSGPLEEEIRERLAMCRSVTARFTGFLQQRELPAAYRSAKIFLFPTASDAWGVVVNEAVAAGLPVICSPNAGVVGDLIINDETGFSIALDEDAWAERVAQLLTDSALYERITESALKRVETLTFDDAADGIRRAVSAVFRERGIANYGPDTMKA